MRELGERAAGSVWDSGPASLRAELYGGSRNTRSIRTAAAAAARRARRPARPAPRRPPSGVEVRADRLQRRGGRSRRAPRSPRRATAPRCPARRSRRTGRARAGPRCRRGSRRGLRGRGRSWAVVVEAARAVAADQRGGPGSGRRRPSRRYRVELLPEARRRRLASSAFSGSVRSGSSPAAAPRGRAPAQQVGVLRDARHAELRQAVLARAEHLARPAQVQVDLGEAEAVALARPAPRAAAASGRRTGCRAPRARRGRSARAAGGAARCRSARPPRSSSPSRSGRRCPTSITLVATSTSASPAANAPIASAFCLAGIWPWISSTR